MNGMPVTPPPRPAGLSRRMLLAVGGLVLLGGCAPGGAGQPDAAAPIPHSPASRRTVSARPAAPPATHPGTPRPRAIRAAEQPVYYVHDGPGRIALTIDDGPSPVYTPQILRLLHKYRIRAAFSMIGVHVAAYPGVARDVADAGHMIVNHTWTHPDLAWLRSGQVREEMDRATEVILRVTGRHPHMFRAPYGAWSPAVLAHCAATGMTPLDWSVDPRDWSRPGASAIAATILADTRSGSIILEHDGGGDRSQTVAALAFVLPRLLAAGFRFQTP